MYVVLYLFLAISMTMVAREGLCNFADEKMPTFAQNMPHNKAELFTDRDTETILRERVL